MVEEGAEGILEHREEATGHKRTGSRPGLWEALQGDQKMGMGAK